MEDKTKTTMSVREMGKILGLKKTESYWLLHKHFFEVISIEKKMRVVTASFEKWYANQVKYKKVDGTPPGEALRAISYSIPEIAKLLGLANDTTYTLISREQLPTFEANFCRRVRKNDFDRWYRSQHRYRTTQDKERDKELEEATISMPEMARLLLITRNEVYAILNLKQNRNCFEIVMLGDQKRITKQSFESWYVGQSKYRKLSDRSVEEQEAFEAARKQEQAPRLVVDANKEAYTVTEAAILLDVAKGTVFEMIRSGELEAKKYANKFMIGRDEIQWWLLQQQLHRES